MLKIRWSCACLIFYMGIPRARHFPLPDGPAQVKLPVGKVDWNRFFLFISYKQIKEFQNSWSWASVDFEKRQALIPIPGKMVFISKWGPDLTEVNSDINQVISYDMALIVEIVENTAKSKFNNFPYRCWNNSRPFNIMFQCQQHYPNLWSLIMNDMEISEKWMNLETIAAIKIKLRILMWKKRLFVQALQS